MLDFGLARAAVELAAPVADAAPGDLLASPVTVTGSVVGTPLYMAPEQWSGVDVDARADQFSFAVAMWEALHGEHPFGGVTWQEIKQRVTGEEVRPPADPERAPAALRDALRRSLRSDPDARHPSMEALLAALRPEPPPHRSRRVGLLVGAGVVAVAAGAAVVIAAGLRPDGEGQRVAVDRAKPEPASAPLEARFASIPAERVTTGGVTYWPAISPDGRTLAYDRGAELVLRELASGRETAAGPSLRRPAWSRDSSRLLGIRVNGEDTIGKAVVVQRDGGERQELSFTCGAWDWWPDGRLGCLPGHTSSEVHIHDLRSERVEKVDISGIDAEWRMAMWISGAGAVLVLATGTRHDALWVRPVGGGKPVKIASETSIKAAAWRWSGDAVLYVRQREDTAELVRRTVDPRTGAAGPPIVVLQGVNGVFSFTADGRTLAYGRRREESDLWWTDLARDGTINPLRRLPTGPGWKMLGTLSPDGSRIAYASGLSEATTEIVVQALDATTPGRPVTSLGRQSLSPVWSPDGERIAFLASDAGAMRVWVVAAEGGDPRVLPRTIASEGWSLAWAPGRRLLYLTPGNRQFHWLDPDSGHEEPLFDAETASQGWVWYPVIATGERRVAFAANLRQRGRGVFFWAEGRATPLTSNNLDVPMGWSVDGRSLYVLGGADPAAIGAHRTSGGPPRLFPLPAIGQVLTATMSANGRTIAIQSGDASSDVWMARVPAE